MWRDDLSGGVDTEPCLVCGKPTNSHLLLLRYVEDEERMGVVAERDDADGFGLVCHSCHRDVDGDPTGAAEVYNQRLLDILDTVGVDMEDMAERPDEVASRVYQCSVCGDPVDGVDVLDHANNHDSEPEFTRAEQLEET